MMSFLMVMRRTWHFVGWKYSYYSPPPTYVSHPGLFGDLQHLELIQQVY
jgi:hypothetical protein